MANAKDLFEAGEDVSDLFEAGEEISAKPAKEQENRYEADINKEVSTGEGLLSGAKRGLTLGFDDEMAAVSGAIGAQQGGDTRPFWDIYKDILDAERQEKEMISEQAPIATFTGEMAGGLLTPAGLLGKAAGEGATFGQKALAMAKMGAKGGAIAGLGTSEADLTAGEPGQIVQAGKDIVGGSTLGAGAGLGMQATGSLVSKAASGVANVAKSMPFTQDIIEMFSRSKKGEELLGKTEEFSQANRDLARSIIDKLSNLRKWTGKIREESLQDVERMQGQVEIASVVDDMMNQINSMEAFSSKEQRDVEDFKKFLRQLVKEETKDTTKLIAKPQLPKASAAEKAEAKVAKKTAEAEAKDAIKTQALEDALQTAIVNGHDEEADAIRSQLQKMSNLTEYPGQTATEELTGMDVAGVSRGPYKQPIVEAVVPEAEPLYTPLKQITEQTTTRGRESLSPTELSRVLSSLQEMYEGAESGVGKKLVGQTKEALKKQLEAATEKIDTPEAKAALQAFEGRTGAFKNIAKTQEQLQLEPYYGATQESEKVDAIRKLQRAIQGYGKPGSVPTQEINEALHTLEQSVPQVAKNMREQIREGATKERLARELVQEAQLGGDIKKGFAGPKSTALNIARSAGIASKTLHEAPQAVSKKMLEVGNKVYDSSPEVIQKLADFASRQGDKASKTTSDLLKSIVMAPQAKRRAMLFTLMQQPDFRKLSGTFFSSEGSEDMENIGE